MINKDMLLNVNSIRSEIKDLHSRLEKIEKREQRVVIDSVRGSSREYPYIEHTCKIEGLEYSKNKNARNKYKKLIKNKEMQLNKALLQIEYELNYVTDVDIRRIIRYKCEDDLTWLQIMNKMGYDSEDVARKKFIRFFKKI